MMVQLTNMVNDTDTDGDGIADAASYSFAYSVSTESRMDYLSFCIDNVLALVREHLGHNALVRNCTTYSGTVSLVLTPSHGTTGKIP